MKRLLLCSIALFYIVLMGDVGFAQTLTNNTPNKTITYQGIITSSETGALLTATIPVTVVMYKDENGTEKVWEGMYLTDINQGVFQIQLGSGEYPLPAVSELDRGLWVGVRLGGSSEMRPLTPLSASPYALSVADRSISAKKMGTDYVASISIDGKKVTNRGSNLNLISGPGVLLNYDESTNSLVMGSSKGIGGQDPTAANGNPPVPWAELGNNSTNPVNDYVGTSDNVPLEFRINGIVGGNSNRVSTAGDGRVMLYDPKANSANIIGGFSSNTANAAEGITIAGGGRNNNINQAFDNFGTIGGGVSNTTGTSNGEPQDEFQVVAGGQSNTASGSHSAITGGNGNSAGGTNSFVGGGSSNSSQNTSTTVAGGDNNNSGGDFSIVGGGRNNSINNPLPAQDGFVGGGQSNRVTDNHGTQGGGRDNAAGNDRSVVPIVGLTQFAPPIPPSLTDAEYATVGGGWSNTAAGYESAVLGGEDNIAFFARGSVLCGFQNFNFAAASTIGGGEENQIQILSPAITRNAATLPPHPMFVNSQYAPNSSIYSTISGGIWNLIMESDNAAIGGGRNNTIGGVGIIATNAVISGGVNNIVSGAVSAILGGESNTIIGSGSGIGGGRLLTLGSSSFGFSVPASAQTANLNLSGFNNVAAFNNVNLILGNTDGAPRDLLLFGSNNVATIGSLSYSGINFVGLRAPLFPTANDIYILPVLGPTAVGAIPFSSAGSLGTTGNPSTTVNTFQLNWASPSGAGAMPFATGSGLAFTNTSSSNQILITDGGGNPGWSSSFPTGMTISATEFVGTGSTSIAVDLETAEVAGILPVQKGGTGVNTIPANRVLVGNGTNDVGTVDTVDARTGMVLTFLGDNTPPEWRNLSSSAEGGWGTTGNSGTNADSNFLGTIEQTDFIVKTDGDERIRVKGTGGVTIANSVNTSDVSLDIEGGFVTKPITIDINSLDEHANIASAFILDVGNRTYIRLHNTQTGNYNRRVVLTGGRVSGQWLIIESAESDPDQKFHFRNQKVNDSNFDNFNKVYLRNGKRLTFDTRDVGLFIFNNGTWLRVSKSSNTNTEPSEVDDDDVD